MVMGVEGGAGGGGGPEGAGERRSMIGPAYGRRGGRRARGSPRRRGRRGARGGAAEDLEWPREPGGGEGKGGVGWRGDEAPRGVLWEGYRGLHHFFRQISGQATNPPIDSLRERRVMTLKTRLGNLGNILDEDPSQCRLLQLDSPVLSNAEFAAMRDYMGDTAVEIDCTLDAAGADGAFRQAIPRIQQGAEDAVRGGCTHVILSDAAVSAARAAIPMILATGAVHSHLVRQQLRTFTSLNGPSAECLHVHYFTLLIASAPTPANPSPP